MVNTKRLRGKMIECGYDAGSLAEALEISKSTFYRKLSGGGQSFTVREIAKMMQALGLTPMEAASIFFNPYVA